MQIKDLVYKISYKKVFNEIYRYYLKNKSKEEVYNLDNNFLSAWNNLLKTKHKKSEHKEINDSQIYLIEVSEDKDNFVFEDYIDVCLYDEENDELFSIDFVQWENLMEKDIISKINLTNEQIMAHILWEITFWGFSAEKVKEAGDNLLNE
ncbi:MAG: DUF6557 family protein [Paracoccaceae bacterium]